MVKYSYIVELRHKNGTPPTPQQIFYLTSLILDGNDDGISYQMNPVNGKGDQIEFVFESESGYPLENIYRDIMRKVLKTVKLKFDIT